MRKPGQQTFPVTACVALFIGATALVAAGFGIWGLIEAKSIHPKEFPVCPSAPPRQNEPVVRLGDCYSSAGFPVDNETLFCDTPGDGETLRWNGSCVDTYPPPALQSLGSPAVLASPTTLRGVAATGLGTASANSSHVVVDVPQPSSAGGTSLIADAASNAFYGLEAVEPIQLEAGSGTVVVREIRWDEREVNAIGIANVNAFVGERGYVRVYTMDGREHGEARGAIYVQYTDPDVLTILQLDVHLVAPIGSGDGWIGPGGVGCVLKTFTVGGVSVPLAAAAAFSHDDGMPYLFFIVPAAYGGGSTIECTFELKYMFQI